MQIHTADEIARVPGQLESDTARGEPVIVTRAGEPLYMAVPLGKGLDSKAVRLELALSLFDRDQISIGLAARIAGIPVAELIDICSQRNIAVVRYSAAELETELAYAGGLALRG